MATSTTSIQCPHCNTALPDREIADGWCDSCGKKLPISLQQEVKRGRPAGASHTGDSSPEKPRLRVLLAGLALALLFSVAAALFLALRGG